MYIDLYITVTSAFQEAGEVASSQVEQLKGDNERLAKERDDACQELRSISEKLSDWEDLMAMLKGDRDRLEAEVSKDVFYNLH